MSIIENKVVLITGGTGSFGQRCTRIILDEYNPKKIIIFSRDEYKQFVMNNKFKDNRLRFFLGDVRNKERLARAFDGVDIVIHTAALKQVPAAEYNPFEFVLTNIQGAQNIIEAAIDKGVERIMALSTDKAAAPINLYGATKLVSDKLFITGNVYASHTKTRFSVVRYGNVVGSRGSVIPFFLKQRNEGILPITDNRMTRFWITKEQAVRFSLMCLEKMVGGELFIPKIPSMQITELARVIGPDCELKEIGIRPGEKLHEVMITNELSRDTVEYDDYFVVVPEFHEWSDAFSLPQGYKEVKEEFEYSSDKNDIWLTEEQLKKMVDDIEEELKNDSIR